MWRTNLRVLAVVFGTLGLYTLIANKIPQVQSEVPKALTLGADVTPEQLVAAGEQVYNGIGGCTTCHGLGTRAPNLLTDEKGTGPIGTRCAAREPGKSCKQYLYESLDNPGAFVASGYEPIMPVVTRQLPPNQIWALIAFLEAQGGTVDVTASDIPAAPSTPTPGGSPGSPGGGSFAGGSTDPQALVNAAGCLGCHKLNGAGGAVGPDLSRLGARRTAQAIRQKILDPASSVTKGFEQFAGVMPKTFGTMMSAAQLEALVQYLAARK
ncbi:MAG: c-type cytochrome [Gemmatimonadales bacterium]